MRDSLRGAMVSDGDIVTAADMPAALTAYDLVYGDGATQHFSVDGSTTYIVDGFETKGTWSVGGDGQFGSFWPPDYHASYGLHWFVDGDQIVGLRFVASSTQQYEGRYISVSQ